MLYDSVETLRPNRNVFNLSYQKKFTCDMGQLIPICAYETYPGDVFELGYECAVRAQPMVAPIAQDIDFKVEYFFVPMRLLFDEWKEFITGGEDGEYSGQLPLWDDYKTEPAPKYSLWDYYGLPLVKVPVEDSPIDLRRRAYNLIWNEYYRDENVMEQVELTNNNILHRCWKKDYFTSALPFRQRGVAPAFPISGTTNVFADGSTFLPLVSVAPSSVVPAPSINVDSGTYLLLRNIGISDHYASVTDNNSTYPLALSSSEETSSIPEISSIPSAMLSGNYPNLKVDASNFATFDVADLRLAYNIQRFLEANARSGVRDLGQFLLMHYGVCPSDSRIQRPEYFGGAKAPIFISEVVQQSGTTEDSPQGNLAGKGLGAASDYVTKQSISEHGYIIGLFSICPRSSYTSQGISKTWTRKSRYEFYFPEFAHLSEQPVLTKELYISDNTEDNNEVFGYQGIYDELRHERDEVCADMRDTFDYWHLSRKFASKPVLNDAFLKMQPSKRIFAVQDEPGFVVQYLNNVKAIRPLPKYGTPSEFGF